MIDRSKNRPRDKTARCANAWPGDIAYAHVIAHMGLVAMPAWRFDGKGWLLMGGQEYSHVVGDLSRTSVWPDKEMAEAKRNDRDDARANG